MTQHTHGLGETIGMVFDIQHYSLHDGPGLRTNVFLKGCGLNCWWCSNPEGRMGVPEIAFFQKECFQCEDCLTVCPTGAIYINGSQIGLNRSQCDICGLCIPVCPSKAFRIIGKEMTAASVVEEVQRDAVFFHPQGGLTLTGGEPALQPGFSKEILKLAQAEGIHTAIETCGAVPWQNLEQLVPYLDLILFDLKHMDSGIHRMMTGQSNPLILENLTSLSKLGVDLIIRIPLIPGFNMSGSSLKAMAGFIRSLGTVKNVHLLGYHTLGRSKYTALDKPFHMGDTAPLTLDEIQNLAIIFQDEGLNVVLGG